MIVDSAQKTVAEPNKDAEDRGQKTEDGDNVRGAPQII